MVFPSWSPWPLFLARDPGSSPDGISRAPAFCLPELASFFFFPIQTTSCPPSCDSDISELVSPPRCSRLRPRYPCSSVFPLTTPLRFSCPFPFGWPALRPDQAFVYAFNPAPLDVRHLRSRGACGTSTGRLPESYYFPSFSTLVSSPAFFFFLSR